MIFSVRDYEISAYKDIPLLIVKQGCHGNWKSKGKAQFCQKSGKSQGTPFVVREKFFFLPKSGKSQRTFFSGSWKNLQTVNFPAFLNTWEKKRGKTRERMTKFDTVTGTKPITQ